MAIIDDILKFAWMQKEVPLPSQEELLSFSNNWSILWRPDFTKQFEIPVPTVADIPNFNVNTQFSGNVPQASISNNNIPLSNSSNYVNPFSQANITPYQPQAPLFQEQQQSLLDRWLDTAWNFLWWAFSVLSPWVSNAVNFWSNFYNTFNSPNNITWPEADLVRQQRLDSSSTMIGKWFSAIQNLFPVTQQDLAWEIKRADDIYRQWWTTEASNIASSLWKSIWAWAPRLSAFIDEWKDKQEIQEKTTSFLDKITPVLWKERMLWILNKDEQDKSLFVNIWNQKWWIQWFISPSATATINATQAAKAIEDFASDLVPYKHNLDYAYDSAIKEWRREDADRIKQQQWNLISVMEKVWEWIKWRTDYKNKNPEVWDYWAENAYNDYLKSQWYKWWLQSYMLEWITDEFWQKINKDWANAMINFSTWKDKLNLIDNLNKKSLLWDINALTSYWVDPIARVLTRSLSAWSSAWKPMDALSVLSPWIDAFLRRPWLISSTAWADLSSMYWVDYSSKQEDTIDTAAYALNRFSDKAPEALAWLLTFFVTEWAWSVNALKNLKYVDDVANVAPLLTRSDKLLKSAEFVVKWIWKETIQNAIIDRLDPTFDNSSNMTLNLLWSLWSLWLEAWALSRQFWLLNSETLKRSINNKIEWNWIANKIVNENISEDEARNAWNNLPEKEKLSITLTDEWAANIANLWKSVDKEKSNIINDLNNKIRIAPDNEKWILEAQLNNLLKEEKKWFVNQELTNIFLSKRWFTRDDAITFWKLLKDIDNPNVLMDDLITIVQREVYKWSEWSNILKWILSDVSTKWKVTWDFLTRTDWDVIFRDWWVVSSLVDNTIWVKPNTKYSLEDMERALVRSQSNNSWVSVVKEIMSKEWDNYKYFDKVLDWKEEKYIMNSDWLVKLNADRLRPEDAILDQLRKESKEASLEYTKFKETINNNKDALWITDEDIKEIEESWVFDNVKNIVDTFIPCK